MKVSGDKTDSMFNRYHIVSERDVAEVKNRMETYLSASELAHFLAHFVIPSPPLERRHRVSHWFDL